ncbi:MAG: hypothetical protein HC774_07740 [Sphingomonadales bacterium]|nr:hypothetical protein [Sphingomonadales bacterium]
MLGYRVQDGMLMLGRIEIGPDCFVGEHCALGLDVRMERGSRLDDMSQLADGQRLEEGRGYRGAPAQPCSVDVPRPLGHKRAFGLGLAQLALIYVMGYLLILSMLPAVAMVATGFLLGGVGVGIAAALASVPVSILWYAAVVVATKRLLIGRLQPGTYPVASRTYLRQWFLAYLMRNTRGILMPLYATIYFPGSCAGSGRASARTQRSPRFFR